MPYYHWDRNVFVTEDVMLALKGNGIKGACSYRLFTDEEWSKLKVNPMGIVDDRPRWSTMFL